MARSPGLPSTVCILSRAKCSWRQTCTSGLSRPTHSHASATTFAELAIKASSRRQIYVSRSLDPHLNLSIEHFLLQKTPPHSTILFLYANRPCVVIGRNQNPWLEVNLPLLRASPSSLRRSGSDDGPVLLVRRRSGGGTVFHDQGNVNYSVICPTAAFSRDKHADMVVRALQSVGVQQAQVNARHDIVLGSSGSAVPRKISGSAYKLTRLRALHHGTCLLSSPNLQIISRYLQSPAKPYIKARGVESVSSPIGNVGVSNELFTDAVLREFASTYEIDDDLSSGMHRSPDMHVGRDTIAGFVGEAQEEVAEIKKGVEELKVCMDRST